MATLAVVAVSGVTKALAESGTSRERNHVINQHKAFKVVKQPGKGLCYAKSAGDDTGKLELSFDGTFPVIVALFDRGIEGDMQYWVDNGPKHTVPASKTKGANTFVLAADVVGPMKAGRALYVHITPVGSSPRTQKFSLMGFTAATRVLASSECRNNKGASSPPNLAVKLTRNSGGGVMVSGSTILPDGMNLLVSLQTDVNGYYSQDTVRVHSGLYESEAFTDRGRPLPPGRYTISISSPLMYLQPLRVQRELGMSGNEIPKAIRQRSPYGDGYTIGYSVSRSLD